MLIAVMLSNTFLLDAITPTPDQIEQFKNLPPAQQKLLAKQLGINLDDLNLTGSPQKLPDVPPVVTPRKLNSQQAVDDIYNLKQNENLGNEEKALLPFGYDLFAGEPTSFTPVTEIPIPAEYVVGPGDEIIIQLFGKENETLNLLVNRNGKIQFPNLGPISVSGLTFDDVRNLLKKRIKNQMIGVDSSISLGELRSMRVFVLGEAYKPGSYEVSSLSTITNVLFVSGGIKEIGSLRNIQLKRKGKLIENFDLYDLLLKGDTSNDKRLLPGDVVFIPSATRKIAVKGEVTRPAIYEFKKGEKIKDLLQMFGGLKSSANVKSVQLNRINKQHVREVFTLNLNDATDLKIKLKNGDELEIGAISDYVNQTVKLTGAATRDGLYRWHEGMKVSDIIRNLNTDVLKITDLGYSIIVREINHQHDIKVIQFSLAKALENKQDEKFNPTLNSHDELILFSNLQTTRKNGIKQKIAEGEITDQAFARNKHIDETTTFDKDDFSREALLHSVLDKLQRQRSVGAPYQVTTLAGEVKFPGDYPLPTNSKISDLIIAGGGLKDSAYALSAEVTRTYTKKSEHVSIRHINIDLDGAFKHLAKDDLVLQSRDVVTVRIKPEWNEVSTVEIKGEVLFPGKYVIQRGETLSQLIKRAGGVTDLAYLKGAVFLRTELKQKEVNLLKEMQQKLKAEIAAESIGGGNSNIVASKKNNALTLVDEIDSTQALGRLVIDLPKIINDPQRHDLILKNGDTLAIPPNSQTISVIGQVQQPTSHIFNRNIDVTKYIRMSGGITEQADDDRIYVIKANGAVMMPSDNRWFSSNKSKLEAGDTIIVPLDTAYSRPLQLWTSVTQIIYQSAVAIATITRI